MRKPSPMAGCHGARRFHFVTCVVSVPRHQWRVLMRRESCRGSPPHSSLSSQRRHTRKPCRLRRCTFLSLALAPSWHHAFIPQCDSFRRAMAFASFGPFQGSQCRGDEVLGQSFRVNHWSWFLASPFLGLYYGQGGVNLPPLCRAFRLVHV